MKAYIMNNYSWHLVLGSFFGWIVSKIFVNIPELSNLAGCISILIGVTTMFIQWPSLKKRVISAWGFVKLKYRRFSWKVKTLFNKKSK